MSLLERRNSYYHKIYNYKERREEVKKKYPPVRMYPLKHCDKYKVKSANLTKKIKLWNRQIKKIDMLTNKIYALGNMVAIFTAYNPRNIGRIAPSDPVRKWFTRAAFYKIGIEIGIEQKLLREYVGAKRVLQPTEDRRKLNRMLSKDRDIASMYDRLKRHIADFPKASDDFLDKRNVKL